MRKLIFIIILSSIVFLVILSFVFFRFALVRSEKTQICENGEVCEGRLIGGDKDEYGCLVPAGYTWCEEKQKCLREWEEGCDKISTFLITIKNAVDIKFSNIQASTFVWRSEEGAAGKETKVNEKQISGKYIEAEDVENEKSDNIDTFFQSQKFKIDLHNEAGGVVGTLTGYKKDQTACLVTQTPALTNKSDIRIECGILELEGTQTLKSKTTNLYTFNYPNNWEEREEFTEESVFIGPRESTEIWMGFSTSPYTNEKDTPENLSQQSLGGQTLILKEDITIDGHKAVMQQIETFQGVRIEAFIGNVKTAEDEGTILVFMEIRGKGADTFIQEFNTILSSIKFTEPLGE